MSHPDFLADSLALFAGTKVAHMGAHQYSDHAGMRQGRSVSGARLWTEADTERLEAHRLGSPNRAGSELDMLAGVAGTITRWVPGTAEIIELGPGTLQSFRSKTLPILKALNKTGCSIVDSSLAFLRDIESAEKSRGFSITPIEDDFFLEGSSYQTGAKPALLCAFGGIITNLIAPAGTHPPEKLLAATLRGFADKIHDGWILLAFDSHSDGDDLIDYYKRHSLFQLNIFDRMKVELPMEGDFDPCAFDYTPVWTDTARQLLHAATLQRDMSFALAGRNFALKAGHVLHIKNSFRFTPAFFEACCQQAGLRVINHWSAIHAHGYLLGL